MTAQRSAGRHRAGASERLFLAALPWLVPVLWIAAALAAGATFAGWLSHLTYPGEPWQTAGAMPDFRDAVWAPGRYLLDGGNPYDPDAYLHANPWAQEFDPYAPAWLLLGVAFGPLPFPVAAGVYLALTVVLAIVVMRTLIAWAAPSLLRVGVPAGLLWLCVWSPGRYSLENGGTLLVALGWVLLIRDVVEHAPARRASVRSREEVVDEPGRTWGAIPSGTWSAAVGLALALLKPQFGLPLVVIALGVGRWAVVWRAALVLLLTSTPILIACSVAAGGFDRYLGSLVRLVGYASSPSASTGLLSAHNGRIDLLGLSARLTGAASPTWVTVVVPLAVLAVAVLVARRATEDVTIAVAAAAALLLALVHQPYDEIVLIAPAALAAGILAARRPISRGDALVAVLGVVPVLHLHRVSTVVVPGLTTTGADVIDVVALTAALVASGAVALTTGSTRTG